MNCGKLYKLAVSVFCVVLFVVLSPWVNFATRENFYIAEEFFYSGEYTKSLGLYRSVDRSKLSKYELDVLLYRLSFFTNLNSAISILSNTTLSEGRELLSFLLSYLGHQSTNIADVINTKDEKEVYRFLRDVKSSGVFDVDLSLKLYFSLSNLEDIVSISEKGDFSRVKFEFIKAVMYRNSGNDEKFEEIVKDILLKYPDSFWAKLLRVSLDRRRTSSSLVEGGVRTVDVEEKLPSLDAGYYLVIRKPNEVIVESLYFKGFKLRKVNDSVYIGPYLDQVEAQKEGERIARDYGVQVRMVRIRLQ
ncbi:MAG: hypothetical protein ABDH28_00310 [Brevinematia bacterium]